MTSPGIRVLPPSETRSGSEHAATELLRVFSAVIFGVLVPLVCLLVDPLVFRSQGSVGSMFGPPLLSRYAVASYAFILLAWLALTLWLLFPGWARWLAGPLLVAGLAALGLAVVLLPLAALGVMVFGIGLLGFLPIGTAWVYLREAYHARRAIPPGARPRTVAIGLVLGTFMLGLPLLAQREVDQRTHALVKAALRGDDATLQRATERLKPFGWMANPRIPLAVWVPTSEVDPNDRLGSAWRAAGGPDLMRGGTD